jgi:riboflavin synthase
MGTVCACIPNVLIHEDEDEDEKDIKSLPFRQAEWNMNGPNTQSTTHLYQP